MLPLVFIVPESLFSRQENCKLMRMTDAKRKADDYLKDGQKYQLGFLPTEQAHPLTRDLAERVKTDLPSAYAVLRDVDQLALEKLVAASEQLVFLKEQIRATLQAGGRIFLAGCGATGRLSLALEFLWRRQHANSLLEQERVIGFMAGGDVALVHALEGFEDFPEYGARHLMALGFQKNDLLIASSEGGETPFVIGAVQKAAEVSSRPVFFAFCNPKALLIQGVERSRVILTQQKVVPIELFVGQMALSGSTRLQACTALMLGIGVCLLDWDQAQTPEQEIKEFLNLFKTTDFSQFKSFTEREAQAYTQKKFVLYETDDLALSVFTDTTERAPTFNLPAFDNQLMPKPQPSLCYVSLPSAADRGEGWQKLLGRQPRNLDWPEINKKTTAEYLLGFDFGLGAVAFREQLTGQMQHRFHVVHQPTVLSFAFQDLRLELPVPHGKDLFHHLLLKLILNTHSTLLMGFLDRYVSNFMTWVYPTNGKLIDRASRYTLMWLERKGVTDVTYAQVVQQIFHELEALTPQESIVLKSAESILRTR